MNNKAISIILGGGQGSRLYPLTATRSKPAVPIAGKYRLVDIPISNCLNSDIKRMFVLTQFNSASLNKHIKHTYQFSYFSDAFVDVLAAEQTPENKGWFQGTADAVRQSLHHFKNYESEYVLILSGDQLYHMDFNKMIEAHEASGAELSIATLPVDAKAATSFGILKADHQQWIEKFIEKPDDSLLPDWTSEVSEEMKQQDRHYLASMGIYLFNKQLLIDVLNASDADDFGKAIIPKCVEENKVLSYEYTGYWTDIGNIDYFFEANLDLTRTLPQFNLFDNKNSVFTRPRVLPPTKVSGTQLDRSLLAEGSIIEAERIEDSIIGVRSRIGKSTVIKRSYVMGNNRFESQKSLDECEAKNVPKMGVGDHCHIENCIIDKNARVGNNVTIIGTHEKGEQETASYVIKEGIVVIKNAAVIPDGTTI
ncbi:MAG: glucose-1-phosphate adenylyltransferase [Flavobacteriaceae bacterium]|nr:glucose-1-phosphate adenylyltransferase [Flavobacteriaceae bacterium]|tara:strand:+ start:40400 stop:41668 length:1269 start_codon:yes stop_codon:yes gene_type:complete